MVFDIIWWAFWYSFIGSIMFAKGSEIRSGRRLTTCDCGYEYECDQQPPHERELEAARIRGSRLMLFTPIWPLYALYYFVKLITLGCIKSVQGIWWLVRNSWRAGACISLTFKDAARKIPRD